MVKLIIYPKCNLQDNRLRLGAYNLVVNMKLNELILINKLANFQYTIEYLLNFFTDIFVLIVCDMKTINFLYLFINLKGSIYWKNLIDFDIVSTNCIENEMVSQINKHRLGIHVVPERGPYRHEKFYSKAQWFFKQVLFEKTNCSYFCNPILKEGLILKSDNIRKSPDLFENT